MGILEPICEISRCLCTMKRGNVPRRFPTPSSSTHQCTSPEPMRDPIAPCRHLPSVSRPEQNSKYYSSPWHTGFTVITSQTQAFKLYWHVHILLLWGLNPRPPALPDKHYKALPLASWQNSSEQILRVPLGMGLGQKVSRMVQPAEKSRKQHPL